MKIVNSSALISKFITKEIEDVYKKYSNISQKEINIVSSFIGKLEDNEIFDSYLNYNDTKEVAYIFDKEEIANMWVFGTSKQEAFIHLNNNKICYCYGGME